MRPRPAQRSFGLMTRQSDFQNVTVLHCTSVADLAKMIERSAILHSIFRMLQFVNVHQWLDRIKMIKKSRKVKIFDNPDITGILLSTGRLCHPSSRSRAHSIVKCSTLQALQLGKFVYTAFMHGFSCSSCFAGGTTFEVCDLCKSK